MATRNCHLVSSWMHSLDVANVTINQCESIFTPPNYILLTN
jgi:hypothetical protein